MDGRTWGITGKKITGRTGDTSGRISGDHRENLGDHQEDLGRSLEGLGMAGRICPRGLRVWDSRSLDLHGTTRDIGRQASKVVQVVQV